MSVQEMARLKQRAADLRDRRAALAQGQQENDAACRVEALKSALEEGAAPRDLEQMVSRAGLLAAQGAALEQALSDIELAISHAETVAEGDRLASDRKAVRKLLLDRLQLAGDIEATLRTLLPKITAFSELGVRIERESARIDGHHRILPALAPEAVGGRLAEFMAGLGYGAWLPLTRPETRPAIAALKVVEEAVQQPYLARFQDEQMRVVQP